MGRRPCTPSIPSDVTSTSGGWHRVVSMWPQSATAVSSNYAARTDTHLREGHSAGHWLCSKPIVKDSKERGFPLIRFVTHMEWALENRPRVDDLLEYEARANDVWLRQDGPVNPVICTYDVTKFGGDVVVDVMRTHPSVCRGIPSLAAAPNGPAIRPRQAANAVSMISFSRSTIVATNGTAGSDRRPSRFSQVSSTENVSVSHRITARSMTFCSSRMLPGQS